MISGAMKMRAPALPGSHNNLHELWMWSAQDFDVAYREAKWKSFLSRLTLRSNKLPSLGELVAACNISHQSDRGLHIVALNRIAGSVGRNEDFDHAFRPLRNHIKQRWISINRAYYMGVPLPPVELIQVDNRYIVNDGHHRISVARAHGQAYLEAHIIRLDMRCRH